MAVFKHEKASKRVLMRLNVLALSGVLLPARCLTILISVILPSVSSGISGKNFILTSLIAAGKAGMVCFLPIAAFNARQRQ